MKGVVAYALAKNYVDTIQKGNESRLRNAESAIHGLATMNINNDAVVTDTTKDAVSVIPQNASERTLKVELRGNTLVNLPGKEGKVTSGVDDGWKTIVKDLVLSVEKKYL